MLAHLSDVESIDPNSTIEDRFKHLELESSQLETENFLIETFLKKNPRKSFQPNKEKSPGSNESASLQRKIDIADKMCLALGDELERIEIKNSDKMRNLNAIKSELDISCQEVSALRISLEQNFQMNISSDTYKLPNGLKKFIENWSQDCKQKRERARLKVNALKRMCAHEEQDVEIKSQVMKQISPAEYVRLQFDSKKCRKQLGEIRTHISELRRNYAVVLSRKIIENRKSIEFAKMRRKIQTEFKNMQATDEKVRIECDQMTETIVQMEKHIEEFRERVNETELPRISISDYAKCKEKCEKLASVVKIVERKLGLKKK